jgi:hypothetical protein
MSYDPTGPQLRYLKSLGYRLEPPRKKDEASELLDVLTAGGSPEKALAAMHRLRERELKQNVRFVLEEIRQIEDVIDDMPCAGFWLTADDAVDPRYQPFVNTFLPLHVAKRFPNLLATLDYEELESPPVRARTVTESGKIVEMTLRAAKSPATPSVSAGCFVLLMLGFFCAGIPLAVLIWDGGSEEERGTRDVEPAKGASPPSSIRDQHGADAVNRQSPMSPSQSAMPAPGTVPDEEVKTDARTWTSADGQFHTEAQFINLTAGVVTLRKADGSTVKVPLDRLSDEDRAWIEAMRRKRCDSVDL